MMYTLSWNPEAMFRFSRESRFRPAELESSLMFTASGSEISDGVVLLCPMREEDCALWEILREVRRDDG